MTGRQTLGAGPRAALALLPLVIRGAALLAALALPVTLLFSRPTAEAMVGIVDVLFLVRCLYRRDGAWLRSPWMVLALLWWGWMLLCSTPVPALGLGEGGPRSCLQALLVVRFFILSAALGHWVLRDQTHRRWLVWVVAALAGWIALECWQQYLLGSNVFGHPRWGDGALTGPFRRPVAGPALVLILFPALLPPVIALARGGRRWRRVLGGACFVLGITTMVLIGQRMPALLTGLGLVACGIAVPRLRPAVLGAALAVGVLLASLPLISPPTFAKLVVKFSDQMHHFPTSPYGQIYIRATVMGLDHPVSGLGFDGFRDGCQDAAYRHGVGWLGVTSEAAAGPEACNIHPHNHYLEAFTAGGVPGLLLFCGMIGVWLGTLGSGLRHRGTPLQVGCFVATLIALWPFASSSAFFTLPNAGWFFLVFGIGLAETRMHWLRRNRPRAYPASYARAAE